MLRWATRRQGLLIAADNPLGITGIADLARPEVRVAHRQPGAGAAQLLAYLLAQTGIAEASVRWVTHPSLNEDDLALSVLQGEADVGLGVEAAARRQQLAFIPLFDEQFDVMMHRRSYFEPGVQSLLAFTHKSRFAERAEALGGYDISQLGNVVYNA